MGLAEKSHGKAGDDGAGYGWREGKGCKKKAQGRRRRGYRRKIAK